MADFMLNEKFDAVTCLFSSIGYLRSTDSLRGAIARMAGHLSPGGVVIVEPWLQPHQWREGQIQVITAELTDGKVVRVMRAGRDGDSSILDTHYLVGLPDGLAHFTERHVLRLFREDEYVEAFEAAGLHPMLEDVGLTGRGLIIAIQPPGEA